MACCWYASIEEICQLNYGVTFQIMKKTDVNGPAAEPIFEYLKAQAPTTEPKDFDKDVEAFWG